MTQRQLPFAETVRDRIEGLLARVDGVRRGTECSRPVYFDDRGQQHANQVASQDRQHR